MKGVCTPFKGDSGAIRAGAGLRNAIGPVRSSGEVSDQRELSSQTVGSKQTQMDVKQCISILLPFSFIVKEILGAELRKEVL